MTVPMVTVAVMSAVLVTVPGVLEQRGQRRVAVGMGMSALGAGVLVIDEGRAGDGRGQGEKRSDDRTEDSQLSARAAHASPVPSTPAADLARAECSHHLAVRLPPPIGCRCQPAIPHPASCTTRPIG